LPERSLAGRVRYDDGSLTFTPGNAVTDEKRVNTFFGVKGVGILVGGGGF
jgi:hypothetical protein